MRELPGVIRQLSEQAADGNLRLRLDAPELRQIREQLKAQQEQRFRLSVGITAVLAGTLVLALSSPPWLGWSLVAAGVVAILAAWPDRD